MADDDMLDLIMDDFYSEKSALNLRKSSGISSSNSQITASRNENAYSDIDKKTQERTSVPNHRKDSSCLSNSALNKTSVIRDVACASVRGQSHIEANIPCEDACYVCQSADQNVVVGCVCDGAGSYSFTRVGAQETSRIAARFLAQHFDKFLHNQDSIEQKLLDQIYERLNPKSDFSENHRKRLYEQIKRQIKNVASVENRVDLQQFREQVVRQIVVPIMNGTQKDVSGDNDDYGKFVNEFWSGYLQSKATARTNEYIVQLNRLVVPDQVLDALNQYFKTKTGIEGRRQFACTVVAFAIHKNGDWVAVHLGDGGIVGRDQAGELKIISLPENGEYANETYFVTDVDAVRHMRVVRSFDPGVPRDICDALLFSDGSELSLLQNKTNTPNKACQAFIDQPFFYLESFDSYNAKMQALIEHNLIPKTITGDDCTLLAIRTRRENDPPPKITAPPKPTDDDKIPKQPSSNDEPIGVNQGTENDDSNVLFERFVYVLSFCAVLLLGVVLGNRLPFNTDQGAENSNRARGNSQQTYIPAPDSELLRQFEGRNSESYVTEGAISPRSRQALGTSLPNSTTLQQNMSVSPSNERNFNADRDNGTRQTVPSNGTDQDFWNDVETLNPNNRQLSNISPTVDNSQENMNNIPSLQMSGNGFDVNGDTIQTDRSNNMNQELKDDKGTSNPGAPLTPDVPTPPSTTLQQPMNDSFLPQTNGEEFGAENDGGTGQFDQTNNINQDFEGDKGTLNLNNAQSRNVSPQPPVTSQHTINN